MLCLPKDVLLYTLTYLINIESITILALVSKKIKNIINTSKLLKIPFIFKQYKSLKAATSVYTNMLHIEISFNTIHNKYHEKCLELINPCVEDLNIYSDYRYCVLTENMFSRICNFTKLKKLRVGMLLDKTYNSVNKLSELTNLEIIEFPSAYVLGRDILSNICKLSNLKELIYCSHCFDEDYKFYRGGSINNDTYFEISGSQNEYYRNKISESLCDTDFSQISNLKKLQKIKFGSESLELLSKSLESLKDLPNLEEFWCDANECLNDDSLKILCERSSLKYLRIGYQKNITNDGFPTILKLNNLSELEFSPEYNSNSEMSDFCKSSKIKKISIQKDITDFEFECICQLNNLSEMSFFSSRQDYLTYDGFINITSLKNLTHLDMGFRDYGTFGNITNGDCFDVISELTNLISLHLGNLLVNDSNVPCLGFLQNLKFLYLGYNSNISKNGMDYIYHLYELEVLDLCSTNFIPDCFNRVSKLKKLKSLKFNWQDKVTDDDIEHICYVTNLDINLSGYKNISDTALGHICESLKLKQLDLSNCCNITSAGLSHIKCLLNLDTLILNSYLFLDLKSMESILNSNSLRVIRIPNVTYKEMSYRIRHLKCPKLKDFYENNFKKSHVTLVCGLTDMFGRHNTDFEME